MERAVTVVTMRSFARQPMKSLPDPRTYAAASGSGLAALAERASNLGSAMQQSNAGKVLIAAVERALAAGDDRQIALASVEAGSASVRNALHRRYRYRIGAPAGRGARRQVVCDALDRDCGRAGFGNDSRGDSGRGGAAQTLRNARRAGAVTKLRAGQRAGRPRDPWPLSLRPCFTGSAGVPSNRISRSWTWLRGTSS